MAGPPPTPLTVETGGLEAEGQEQEERVDNRKNRKTVATKAERTRTGTVTTMPFDVAGDDRSAIYNDHYALRSCARVQQLQDTLDQGG